MSEQNKAVVRQIVEEVIGRKRFDLLPQILAPEYVAHLPIGDHFGSEGLRIAIAAIWTAIPDLSIHLHGLVSEGDCVARRYTLHGTQVGALYGRHANGRATEFQIIAIDRFVGDRLAESWVGSGGTKLPDLRARGP